VHSARRTTGVLCQESGVCYSRILATALNSIVIGTVKAQNWDLKTNAQSQWVGIYCRYLHKVVAIIVGTKWHFF
jgi:hypothetical protein